MFTCHIDQQYLMERSSFLLSSPDPSLFFPLSPPTFDHDSLHELLVTSSHLLPSNGAPPSDHTSGNQTTGTITAPPTRVFSGSRVKRTHRKDRHSKIVTAKGARDRRMRLSLDVARKFFDLQDTLGFDKASETVDWLLTRSEAAIKDLTRCFSGFNSASAKSESSTSECEVVSLGLVDSERSLVFATVQGTETGEVIAPPKAKMVMTRAFRKSVTHPTLAKQLRILARARARERTREKMIRRQEQFASSSSHFETTVEESASQDMKSSVEFMAEVEQPIPPHSPNRCERTTAHERADETLSIMAMNVVPGLMSLSDCDQNFIHNGDYLNFLQEQWNMLLS